MALTITAIISEYGAYYVPGGQNEQRLKRLMLFGRETTKIATQVKTDATIYQMGNSALSQVVQPFQKGWTPKGDVTFTPNPIPLEKFKVDLDIYPDEIEESWLGFLASNNLSRKEWPLVRYIMEEHLVQRIDNDMESLEYYKGEKTAVVAGTAGATGTTMDGLKKTLITDKVNHLTMAALSASTIYDQVEEAYESISEAYQNAPMLVCMSPKWKRAFLKDKRAAGFYEITKPGEISDTLDFTPGKVCGLPSMIGTDDIFITPVSNLIHPTKKGGNANTFKVEESKRCVSIMTDWYEGLGFGINAAVWTNVVIV